MSRDRCLFSRVSLRWLIKVACRVKTNTAWTTKNTSSSHCFSKKFKSDTPQGYKRYMKIFELKINNLHIRIFATKNGIISIKNSTFSELQVLIELIFSYNFNFRIFILQESSKRCLIFPTSLGFLRNDQTCRVNSYCSITY